MKDILIISLGILAALILFPFILGTLAKVGDIYFEYLMWGIKLFGVLPQ